MSVLAVIPARNLQALVGVVVDCRSEIQIWALTKMTAITFLPKGYYPF